MFIIAVKLRLKEGYEKNLTLTPLFRHSNEFGCYVIIRNTFQRILK